MIVATAGHVDHGKTALIRSLTGIDTDRLPEEQKRGLTIDLGFAHHEFAGGAPVSFIDVPGHRRFIHNMLAGVAAVDLVLLVVAADDGVMPQTREHLAIVDLIGVTRGLIALSKIDRVDATRCREVIADIEALVSTSALAGAEILPVSATTGEGIEALAEHLEARAADIARRPATGHFRLAVDRAFSVPGAGIVATGTVFSGAVAVGDELVLSPQGSSVRVRGLQTRESDAGRASAGDRCALNLTGSGLELHDIRRGDWIQRSELHRPTRRLDARLQVLGSETAAFRHWTPVHIHLGAAHRTGRIALLEDRSIAPDHDGLAQIVLDEPLCAVAGDRFIIRDQSAQRTVGGGGIVFPYSPARGRARPERLAEVRAMENRPPIDALSARTAVSTKGVPFEEFLSGFNLTEDAAKAMLGDTDVIIAGRGATRICLSPNRWAALREEIQKAVDAHHEAAPNALGLDEAALRKALGNQVERVITGAIVASLIEDAKLVKSGTILHRPDHTTKASPDDDRLWHAVHPIMKTAGLRPPVVREIADRLNIPHTDLDKFLARMTRFGRTVKVVPNRYFPSETVIALGEIAGELSERAGDDGFTAREFRDATGIGRNLTIELLEFFDRSGLTRRAGDKRRLVRPVEEVFAVSSD